MFVTLWKSSLDGLYLWGHRLSHLLVGQEYYLPFRGSISLTCLFMPCQFSSRNGESFVPSSLVASELLTLCSVSGGLWELYPLPPCFLAADYIWEWLVTGVWYCSLYSLLPRTREPNNHAIVRHQSGLKLLDGAIS